MALGIAEARPQPMQQTRFLAVVGATLVTLGIAALPWVEMALPMGIKSSLPLGADISLQHGVLLLASWLLVVVATAPQTRLRFPLALMAVGAGSWVWGVLEAVVVADRTAPDAAYYPLLGLGSWTALAGLAVITAVLSINRRQPE